MRLQLVELVLQLTRRLSCCCGHAQIRRKSIAASASCQTPATGCVHVVVHLVCSSKELQWSQYRYMMITRSLRALQAARTSASLCRLEVLAAKEPARQMSSGPTTATPPADASRGATADLCDVFLPDPVDVITESKVSIVAPLFRCRDSLPPTMHAPARPQASDGQLQCDETLPFLMIAHIALGRDYGGNLRFSGQAATVKCFENNPLVRKVPSIGNDRPSQ